MRIFPLHATDFYKTGHIKQYPEGTTLVYSNFTCRSDNHASNVLPDFDHKVVFFGLQGVCQYLFQDLWNYEFFYRELDEVIEQYKARMDSSLGPDAVSMDHIAALHDLGYLPIRIKALPEGSRVNMRIPLLTIVNTLPEFYWVTNYIETQLSAELWKPITTATTAYEYKRLLTKYAEITGSPLEFVQWQGHDFSARGLSGIHDQATSAAGHLLSFFGTDTVAAIDYLDDYYMSGWDDEKIFIGGSVPATEHSVMCMGGEDDEVGTIRRLITEVYPSGIVSVVSDTWDFWHVITDTAEVLKQDILNRKPDALGFAKVVFRPDSGDPVKIIVGDKDAPKNSPEWYGAVGCLWSIFGGTTTDQGFKVLDSHVGLIYGDSITIDIASRILEGLYKKGFASCNIVFGIGSHTYQYVTRDTFGTAVKATFGVVNGEDRILFKKPKTDSGVKNSARGLLRIEKEDGDYVCYEEQTWQQESEGLLETIFEDSCMMRFTSLSKIRARLQTE